MAGASEQLPRDSASFRRRSRPRVVLLDPSYEVLFAEDGAEWVLAGPSEPKLNSRFERRVRHAVATRDSSRDLVIFSAGNVLVRVAFSALPLSGIALLVEPLAVREELAGASRRYGLSRRQLDVLRLLLVGGSVPHIAAQLGVAESTVTEHVRKLQAKTHSRSRTEMLAKVMGWADESE